MIRLAKLDLTLLSIAVVGSLVATYSVFSTDQLQRTVLTSELGTIDNIEKTVKVKPYGSFDWQNITELGSNTVYESDYIFSGENSGATVNVNNGDTIQLGPNSLILLSQNDREFFRLVVYDGFADYKTAGNQSPQRLQKSEELIFSKSKKKSKFSAVSKKIFKPRKPRIVISQDSLGSIDFPVQKVEPVVSSPVVAIPPPPPPTPPPEVVAPVLAPPQPRLYVKYVTDLKTDLILPEAQKRYSGKKPILKVTWPRMDNTLKYTIAIYNVKDSKTPLYSASTRENEINMEWASTGHFKAEVKRFFKSTARQPASIPNPEQGIFRMNNVATLAPLKAIFPLDKQFVLIEKKRPVYLQWQKNDTLTDYVIQISQDSEFKSIKNHIYFKQSDPMKANLSQLPAGVWFWRIKGLSKASETPWSSGYKFKLLHKE